MSVQVARHAGLCMGVRRAVLEAMKAADTENDIATIGELVHNPEVIRKLEEIGVRAVTTPAEAPGRTVIIRSHGVGPDVYRELDALGLKTIDLTCPFVQKLHTIVAQYSATGRTVIFGGPRRPPRSGGHAGFGAKAMFIRCTILQQAEGAAGDGRSPRRVADHVPARRVGNHPAGASQESAAPDRGRHHLHRDGATGRKKRARWQPAWTQCWWSGG